MQVKFLVIEMGSQLGAGTIDGDDKEIRRYNTYEECEKYITEQKPKWLVTYYIRKIWTNSND
jgi:hypothetical protein